MEREIKSLKRRRKIKRRRKRLVSIALILIIGIVFNHLKNGNGNIKNKEDILVLVNKEYSLDKSYKPKDLVVPNVAFTETITEEERFMKAEAAKALEELFDGAKKDDIKLIGLSGYRSAGTQKILYDNMVKSRGKDYANSYVALPKHSEHQTGLAMDITNERGGNNFGESVEGKWVKENAHKFGFIIRYPQGKENITGYSYEPWHVRYVGIKNSKDINNNNLTLEEYLSKN